MRTVLFAVSKRGCETALKTADVLSGESDIKVYIKHKCGTLAQGQCVTFFDKEEMGRCVHDEFDRADALIFVCAAGIAVRMIAPCLVHKSSDPAVLVLDEGMNYCIPILSGHLGGANALARKLSDDLKCLPVITTASDIAGLTAADMFAKSYGLAITDFDMAKELTSALLDGAVIGVINEAPDVVTIGEDDLPGGYVLVGSIDGTLDNYIRIAYKGSGKNAEIKAGSNILTLVPLCLSIGIGCRRGTKEDKIREAVNSCFQNHGLRFAAVIKINSIDLKSDEEGLLDYSQKTGIPVSFYPAGKLNGVKGDFDGSPFVEEVIGVDNVCERSALAEGGRLIVKKEKYDGVTVAVAVKGYE